MIFLIADTVEYNSAQLVETSKILKCSTESDQLKSLHHFVTLFNSA